MTKAIARLETFNAGFVHGYNTNAPRTEAELGELSAIVALLRNELRALRLVSEA